MKIRQVNAADAKYAAIVADLHSKLFPNIQFPVPHWGHWWVAFDANGAPVGFAQLVQSHFYPTCGYFARVGVLEQARGQGLQRRFMKLAERQAVANGWNLMVSDTTKVPFSAANFEKLGWVKFLPADPWGKKHTIYWRKDLV